MNDIEKRARELLAEACERQLMPGAAEEVRKGRWDGIPAMVAIRAALTPPEGYVLIRVLDARRVVKGNPSIGGYELSLSRIAAALASRPEVP